MEGMDSNGTGDNCSCISYICYGNISRNDTYNCKTMEKKNTKVTKEE